MSQDAIVCTDLRRVYRGRNKETVAIDNLNLSIDSGQIFGLLGPNGAGKTTLIKILTTLLTPTSGSASVAGHDVATSSRNVRRHIGFVFGGDRGLYYRLSGRDNLLYFGALYGLSRAEAHQRTQRLLGIVGLSDVASRRVEQYSRGMRQRLHIARGLLNDPEVLFLDEPTIGLDPEGARELRAIVANLREEARTVLLTTHYMLDADLLCDRLAIITGGRILTEGTTAEVKQSAPQTEIIEVELAGLLEPGLDHLGDIPGVQEVATELFGDRSRVSVRCHSAGPILDRVLEALRGEAQILGSYVRVATLEDAYIALLNEARAGGTG